MSRLLITRAATVLNNRPTNLLHRPFFGGVKKMLGLQTEADKRKERINTEIDKFTENAPLFVKGLAMMVKPIINKVASSMHAAQERSDAMLADARYVTRERAVEPEHQPSSTKRRTLRTSTASSSDAARRIGAVRAPTPYSRCSAARASISLNRAGEVWSRVEVAHAVFAIQAKGAPGLQIATSSAATRTRLPHVLSTLFTLPHARVALRYMLISSREVTDLIGTQISTGEPLSMQQSHVERNNGEGMERKMAISMTFQVTGERGQGLATLKSANGEIMELSVKVNNRTIHVSLGSRLGDDDVYEAEFRPKN